MFKPEEVGFRWADTGKFLSQESMSQIPKPTLKIGEKQWKRRLKGNWTHIVEIPQYY